VSYAVLVCGKRQNKKQKKRQEKKERHNENPSASKAEPALLQVRGSQVFGALNQRDRLILIGLKNATILVFQMRIWQN